MSRERAEVVLPLSDLGSTPPPAPTITIPVAPLGDEHVEAVLESASQPEPLDLPDPESLDSLLGFAASSGASDLILAAGNSPSIRVDGELRKVPGCEAVPPEAVEAMLAGAVDGLLERLASGHEARFAYTAADSRRFRVEVFQQRGSLSASFRVLPAAPPELESLALASILDHIAALPSGLVIVAGPVGSGRSTTLSAIVGAANRTRHAHIVTIEDPIEVLQVPGSCVISQRAVGVDVDSTAAGLASARRAGADIVVVGDLVDPAEVELALAAAEGGLLVLMSNTSPSVRGVIERIVETTAVRQQPQLRERLAGSLQAIVCQVLCAPSSGSGRVVATEVLVATDGVRELITDGRLERLTQVMVEGSKVEMHTLNQDLAILVRDGRISADVALERCSDASELRRYLGVVG